MSDILRKIVASKRREVARLMKQRPLAEVREQALAMPPVLDFASALRGGRPRGVAGMAGPVNIIAEIKVRSPSKGAFPWHGDPVRQARDYERGGARAISVVTDGPFFGGSPQLLREVKAATALPVMQKEFLLQPWQVYYARALGADACLLIAAILPEERLAEMLAAAREVGIQALVEVVDAEEFQRASQAGARVVGVNNRDLKTFTVDPARTERLLHLYGEDQICIAESGIRTQRDVRRLLRAGVDGFLIGEALMTARDPAAHLQALRGVAHQGTPPRAAARRGRAQGEAAS
ncbi:MAG: indole-3-glycerol phosphate synthase TrpC [SAR324 cluster bacterium]|nr:indole-3-glycerol phosphate synthase TrpC [SAR324 cluster bacterium]